MAAIDVGEILAYKATDSRKRPTEDAADLNGEAKRVRADGDAVDEAALLEAADAETEPLDEVGVKKLILNLEKRALKNREMRIKFDDDPVKFLDSEAELHVAIQEMHAVATLPELYPLLVQLDAVKTLLQLLAHENTDISTAVVDLMQELTDADTLADSEDGAMALLDALETGQLVAQLVHNVERLDEAKRDDADAVHNSLAIVENALELRPGLARAAVDQGLLAWLLKRAGRKGAFDANKLYASELLGVLLQQSDEARRAVGERGGVDSLLQALAAYKRHDPSSADEREHMENLFDCLCAALMHAPNRARFLVGEGLQLMNLMLRERKDSRASALKVLDHATTGDEGADNCDKLIDILGLRTLFPLFMRTPSKHRRRGHSALEHEEHVCAVVASLLRRCSADNRQRLLLKFTEQDHVKVDRLVELHNKYEQKVARFERAPKPAAADADDAYLQRLDAGLFTLQLVDVILADVCVNGAPTIRERALKLFSMKAKDFAGVRRVLDDYGAHLGDDAAVEKQRVADLISALAAL